MYLSEVKLESLKNFANFSDNNSLTLEAVRRETSEHLLSSKYNVADSNFWNALNTFLSQLSSRDKLHPITAFTTISSVTNQFDIKNFIYTRPKKDIQIGHIYSVYVIRSGKFYFPPYQELGNSKFLIYNFELKVNDSIYVQFRPILPRFSQEDILLVINDISEEEPDKDEINNDIEMFNEYSIDNNMLDIGINYYIPALLNKDSDRDRYTNDLSIGQSLINNLEYLAGDTILRQSKVKKYNGGFRF